MPQLELYLDRSDVSVIEFAEAFVAQVKLVQQVMGALSVPSQHVRWVVADLRGGSAFASAQAQVLDSSVYMIDVDRAIKAAGEGFRALTESAERPPYFNDEALKLSRRIVEIASASNAGNAVFRFGTESVKPSPSMLAHVDEIVQSDVASIGSIEGRLVGVQGTDGQYNISVRDRLRNRRVKCVIRGADLLGKALAAFEQDVVVRGRIWSRLDGTRTRIEVRSLDPMPRDNTLPTAEQIRGILSPYQRADGE